LGIGDAWSESASESESDRDRDSGSDEAREEENGERERRVSTGLATSAKPMSRDVSEKSERGRGRQFSGSRRA
jgi:hypothetical protein